MIEINTGETTYRIGFDSQGIANVVPDAIGFLLDWSRGTIEAFAEQRGWKWKEVEEKP